MSVRPAAIGALCFACLFHVTNGIAAAQSDSPPIGKTPYHIRIVALLSDHRFLNTESFQARVAREIAQRTQLALGELVRVDTAVSHPLADVIRRDGLDAALDGHEEVSWKRTWFFTVEVRSGIFELRGRYFDGLTGTPGPKSSIMTTGDRGRLATLAASMIAEKFALVGVVKSAKADSAELAIVGGELATPGLTRGAAFAISRIAAESGKDRARKLPWAILEAAGPAVAGKVPCRFWRRFADDSLAATDNVTYRAILLPTIAAPARIRVIDHDTAQPLAGIRVSLKGQPRDFEVVTDAAGMAASPEAMSGLAIVTLARGSTPLAQFPLAIVDDMPAICEISPKSQADDVAGLEIRKMQLIRRMLATRDVVHQRSGEQQVLLNQSLEETLTHAKGTLRLLDNEIAAISAERDEIHLLEVKRKPGKTPGIEADKGIARLKEFRQATAESIARIAEAIKTREEQTEKQKQAFKLEEQASLLEGQAKFDEAIASLKKAAELFPESARIGKRLSSLQSAWDIKNEKHAAARRYLLVTWPNLEIDSLRHHLPLAEKQLDVCRSVGDRLTPRGVIAANIDHVAKITKVAEQLKKSQNADDQRQRQVWKEFSDALLRFTSQASELAHPTIAEKKD
jgi:hypothetical protein